jgi:hypothetical protein
MAGAAVHGPLHADLGYMSPLPAPGSAAAAGLPQASGGAVGEADGLAPDGAGGQSWTFDHRSTGGSRDQRNAQLDAEGRAAQAARAAGAPDVAWALRDFRATAICDGRPAAGSLSLDREGFVLRQLPSAFAAAGGDFYDPAVVEQGYYPEVEALLLNSAGVDRALVFDHITRDVAPPPGSAATADPRGYVTHVHCDYTEAGAWRRAEQLLGADAAQWAGGGRRLGILQLWRPIGPRPVAQQPLALLDAATVAPAERIQINLQYGDRVGHNYYLAHSPAHRWLYFPEMDSDECVLFKCFDSAPDRAQFCFHTSFVAPPPAGAGGGGGSHRRSIEARALVSWPVEPAAGRL